MATLRFDIRDPLHAKLKDRIRARVMLAKKKHETKRDEWIRAEERCLAYVHETEQDNARRNERDRGTPKYTTIMIPYTYGMLMSAHTYWTSVFFARSPIHQYSGRHGEGEMQTQAMEALIGYQVDVGAMVAPYYIWLYDTGKYGHGVLGHYWCKEVLQYGELVEIAGPNGKPELYQATREVQGYTGNRAFNVSPWDFMHDPRVALKDFQKGEFCIRRVRMGWNEILKRRRASLYNDNIKYLKGNLTDKGSFDGSSALVRPQFDLETSEYLEETSKHAEGGTFYEVYVDVIPEEWGLGKGLNFPQKWVFTITENLDVIIGASPLSYAHCLFPFDVLECEVEGYGLYTRGYPEIMSGVQDTIDWLLNTHFYNVRAALNNQFIVDPSKLVIKDVQNSGPGFLWRLRPEAYGTDLTKMFLQVPVNDVTRANISDFQTMLGIGERTLGINDQIMGSLNTGSSRKTATEVRTTTGFGVNRMKTVTEYMSAAGFSAHSQKLVQTSQQFYDAVQKLRRVGSFALEAGEGFMNVSPEDIVGQFDFVPVDGTLPIDRMAQANLWKEIMANLRNMPPQVAMSYDWARIFAWTATLGGLKNINQFRIQMMPDAALAQQAQMGNVIPMPMRPGLPAPGGSGVEPGNSASTAAGLNGMGAQQ